uniref:Molybdopterin biosynthesis protein n=1 Tax=Thaumatella adunca TaxID=2006976 RepID=A0A1Z1MP51_9FLOR|nr:Molybdopterin biosynthesis protein [Thaumatella adunca]ARW67521.1 Molybdopterin biosynthesis protein [Thaumatella adunca]
MLNPNNKQVRLSHEEYTRYSKQIILENIGIESQKRLKKSKILIIGAGGLGCPVMIYLATSGIGHIGVIDKDIVELSNLNRQILYKQEDIKNLKVLSAKSKIKEINNNCKIITHSYYLNQDNIIEVISNYDIIIDTTDNFKIRYLIDETCHKLHKIHIYGAIEKFEGQVGVFNYKNGFRYKNLYKKNLKIENNNCSRNGIMGITTAYIGILQTIETIKIILGLNIKSRNYILLCNTLDTEIIRKKIYKQKDNIKLSKNIVKKLETKCKISESELKLLKNKVLFIDLREKNKFHNKHIKQSINIPIIKFKINTTIKFIINNTRNKVLIIYCDKTERSIIASYFLKNHKIKHYILKTINKYKAQ